MTVAYFDTSALIKLFLAEPGSSTARRAWQASETVAGGRLLYAEARAALAAASRDSARGFGAIALQRAKASLDSAWQRMVKVEATETLVHVAGDLAEAHGLRGYDAVHLAGALRLSAEALVTADADLLRAGAASGLGVIDARR